MEEKKKQNSAAITRNVNKISMGTGVIPKQEMRAGDQLSCAEEELMFLYLEKKMIEQRVSNHTILEVDFFLYHPQQLSQMHHPSQEKEWYFLSPATASDKYREGGQSNITNNDGYWEPYGTDSPIHKDGKLLGYRKTLNYIEGKHMKDRKRTEWLMHEYRLDGSRDLITGMTSDDMQWVLCKLFKLNSKFIAAEEKEATKFAGPKDGVSSTEQTSRGQEKGNNMIINDKEEPSNGLSCDLHPLLDTDQGTTTPHSQHDQGTMLSTPKPRHGRTTTPTPSGPHKARENVVNNKRPGYRRKGNSNLPVPASDQGIAVPQFPVENSLPQCNQETVLPLLQNDQRTMLPTCTGLYKANNGVVTDNGPCNSHNCDSNPVVASSQGLMIPRCSEKVLDRPTSSCSFGGTIVDQHGTVPPPVQVPKPPLPRYDGWPLYTAETRLPLFREPFQSLTEEELAFFDAPDPGYPQAYENKKEAKKG